MIGLVLWPNPLVIMSNRLKCLRTIPKNMVTQILSMMDYRMNPIFQSTLLLYIEASLIDQVLFLSL